MELVICGVYRDENEWGEQQAVIVSAGVVTKRRVGEYPFKWEIS